MRDTLVLLTLIIFGSTASAGYKGIPSYEFDYTSTSIENVKAKVDECRKAIKDEKKKVTSSGYKIVRKRRACRRPSLTKEKLSIQFAANFPFLSNAVKHLFARL